MQNVTMHLELSNIKEMYKLIITEELPNDQQTTSVIFGESRL